MKCSKCEVRLEILSDYEVDERDKRLIEFLHNEGYLYTQSEDGYYLQIPWVRKGIKRVEEKV